MQGASSKEKGATKTRRREKGRTDEGTDDYSRFKERKREDQGMGIHHNWGRIEGGGGWRGKG